MVGDDARRNSIGHALGTDAVDAARGPRREGSSHGPADSRSWASCEALADQSVGYNVRPVFGQASGIRPDTGQRRRTLGRTNGPQLQPFLHPRTSPYFAFRSPVPT